jgi:hypothetical protein
MDIRQAFPYDDRSFFHAAKYTIVIFIAPTPGAVIVLLIICDALLTFFHLDVSIKMDLVASIALGLAWMAAGGESSTGEGILTQILCRNVRNRGSIIWKRDWDGPWSTGAPKAAGEKLDGGCQTIIFVVATNA